MADRKRPSPRLDHAHQTHNWSTTPTDASNALAGRLGMLARTDPALAGELTRLINDYGSDRYSEGRADADYDHFD